MTNIISMSGKGIYKMEKSRAQNISLFPGRIFCYFFNIDEEAE